MPSDQYKFQMAAQDFQSARQALRLKTGQAVKPAKDRVYGYFCFPILHKNRLVGRFDPKLDRKTGVLHLNALYLEPGIKPDDELVTAAAMRDFLSWHGAKSLKIEKSDPAAFGKKLMKAL